MIVYDIAARQRQLDNELAACINVLSVIKNQTNIPVPDKLKGLVLIAERLPEIRRLLIFMMNVGKN